MHPAKLPWVRCTYSIASTTLIAPLLPHSHSAGVVVPSTSDGIKLSACDLHSQEMGHRGAGVCWDLLSESICNARSLGSVGSNSYSTSMPKIPRPADHLIHSYNCPMQQLINASICGHAGVRDLIFVKFFVTSMKMRTSNQTNQNPIWKPLEIHTNSYHSSLTNGLILLLFQQPSDNNMWFLADSRSEAADKCHQCTSPSLELFRNPIPYLGMQRANINSSFNHHLHCTAHTRASLFFPILHLPRNSGDFLTSISKGEESGRKKQHIKPL